ncbi:MAG TPA: hypothetical protein VHQ45_17045 [Gemmatimonadaceae bacterium]|jgi:hypothetical protein|nr:hypothetical protein [Gemmatimonadaceae bacterium]
MPDNAIYYQAAYAAAAVVYAAYALSLVWRSRRLDAVERQLDAQDETGGARGQR